MGRSEETDAGRPGRTGGPGRGPLESRFKKTAKPFLFLLLGRASQRGVGVLGGRQGKLGASLGAGGGGPGAGPCAVKRK